MIPTPPMTMTEVASAPTRQLFARGAAFAGGVGLLDPPLEAGGGVGASCGVEAVSSSACDQAFVASGVGTGGPQCGHSPAWLVSRAQRGQIFIPVGHSGKS